MEKRSPRFWLCVLQSPVIATVVELFHQPWELSKQLVVMLRSFYWDVNLLWWVNIRLLSICGIKKAVSKTWRLPTYQWFLPLWGQAMHTSTPRTWQRRSRKFHPDHRTTTTIIIHSCAFALNVHWNANSAMEYLANTSAWVWPFKMINCIGECSNQASQRLYWLQGCYLCT